MLGKEILGYDLYRICLKFLVRWLVLISAFDCQLVSTPWVLTIHECSEEMLVQNSGNFMVIWKLI